MSDMRRWEVTVLREHGGSPEAILIRERDSLRDERDKLKSQLHRNHDTIAREVARIEQLRRESSFPPELIPYLSKVKLEPTTMPWCRISPVDEVWRMLSGVRTTPHAVRSFVVEARCSYCERQLNSLRPVANDELMPRVFHSTSFQLQSFAHESYTRYSNDESTYWVGQCHRCKIVWWTVTR